ncbi:unnamed protein product [Mytilus coruscus]|uniref:PAN-3 domain-containing protein n=1 Tax=Mytilus coruscus TaxID=42192 RepID=A0A6J8D0W0_MYTCO|nr:unnamed protein product [Mytilus coruscus]
MTAGKGWTNNATIFAVKEKVTWYSAMEAVNCQFGKLLIPRSTLLKTFAENTQVSDRLNDSIVWIGAIKSEYDGQLYYSDTCTQINLDFIDLPKLPGRRECVFLNISVKTMLFGYDDCMALHPYLCLTINEPIEPVIFENVTVQSYSGYNVDMIQKDNTQDWENCTKACTTAMNCIAALFSWTEINCVLYKDGVSGIFESKNVLLISNVTEKTKLYLSSWKRGMYFSRKLFLLYWYINLA